MQSLQIVQLLTPKNCFFDLSHETIQKHKKIWYDYYYVIMGYNRKLSSIKGKFTHLEFTSKYINLIAIFCLQPILFVTNRNIFRHYSFIFLIFFTFFSDTFYIFFLFSSITGNAHNLSTFCGP